MAPFSYANRTISVEKLSYAPPWQALQINRLGRSVYDMGAGMTVSEMLSSNPQVWKTDKSRLRMVHRDELGVRSVQIAGNDPDEMAAAAQINVESGAQIIDINMGCPAKK